MSAARLKAVLIVIDVQMLALATLFARVFRYSQVPGFNDLPGWAIPRRFLLLMVVVWLAALLLVRAYDLGILLAGYEVYRRIFLADTLALIFVIFASYVIQAPNISRGFLALLWLLMLVFVSAGRFIVRQAHYARSARGQKLNRVIVVGANRHGLAIARQLQRSRSASSQVLGFLDDFTPVGREVQPGLKVLGDPMAIFEVAAELGATHAVVVESGLSWESHQWLIRNPDRTASLNVLMASGLYDLAATRMELAQLGPVLLVKPSGGAIVGFEAYLKRGLDIAGALALLLLALPLELVILWRSWPDALRPRDVVGFGGHPFRMLEFRALPGLKRFHLVRLPSLLNVLNGSMSLIGPRPIDVAEAGRYADWAPVLASAKPGFMGPWWLIGLGRPQSLDEEIILDLHYLRNYTIWFDLHVLVQTLRLLLRPAAWQLGPERAAALTQAGEPVSLTVLEGAEPPAAVAGGGR